MINDEPSWDHYRTFLAVLDGGSLSAAARELALTQPTAGRHIEALEQILGLSLFTRSQQGLAPTEAARDLEPYARTLSSTAAALRRAASGQRDAVSGIVRISASDVIGVEVLPSILAQLQEDHPQLTIELSLSDAVEDLLQRAADIAVRMTAPAQDALLVRRIGTIPLQLHAHRRYLDRHGTPDSIEALQHHRLIGFDREKAYIRAMRALAPQVAWSGFAYRSDSNLAQLAAIRAGAGIGVCQTLLAARDPALVPVLSEEIVFPLETWVVMHEDLKAAARCRVTFDALVAGLGDYIHSARR